MADKQKGLDLDKIVNAVVSIGAAVVIFGAWAKILHKSFADVMLTVGLLTEALIFVIYAFYHPKDPINDLAKSLEGSVGGSKAGQGGLDALLKENVDPANLQQLNENFAKFNKTVQGVSALADATAATNEYALKTKEASAALGSVKEAYVAAAGSVQQFNAAAEGSKAFHDQVQSLTKNLGSLNKMYEAELQGASSHMKTMAGFYENLVKASQAMQGSVDDAKKTQEQIALLAKNLGSLNSVYGNMLSAMQVRG
ncbi:MAG: gliding motility protein GldL [Bacteroidota bacterium]|jgi:gliding motility-associated protein GldL